MKTKRVFYSEAAYALGIVALALGTALMARADFGMSVAVAPAYLLHLKLSPVFPAFTFGVAEYLFQAGLLILLSLALRRFRAVYLLSFVTTVLYALALDAVIALGGLLPPLPGGLGLRVCCFIAGELLCASGVSLFFRTYLPPEVYELLVKEIARHTGADVHRVKMAYDGVSCAVSVAMSFAFFGFGHFEGVKLGTAALALVNGRIIRGVSRAMETRFEFKDALGLRARFEARRGGNRLN